MSNNNKQSVVIDLTSSFTLIDHCALSNVVIDLDSDESFDSSLKVKSPKKKVAKVSKLAAAFGKTSSVSPKKIKEKKSSKIGNCPICWDELGKNPLASTKCGHVYCLECLEKSLKLEKRCPTCRRILKGKTAYHPLYLSKD